jgi:epoxyqueuosine reductase
MPIDSTGVVKNLSAQGYQARVVKVSRALELEASIETLRGQGCFSPDFYDKELAKFLDFNYAAKLPQAKSIVIMAAFQPPTRVRFGDSSLVIPPTYIYRDIWEGSLNTITELLIPEGYHVARARLPLKTLAVRSGLGSYGRNNICYVPGMGSFHRLGAFYADMPCVEDNWQEPAMMEMCEKCRLCQTNCPTGAILPDRFLVDAGRCLTFFNEHEEDFPDWVKPEWHNAILGCMKCQEVCPADRKLISKTIESTISFTAEETGLIRRRTPLEKLPAKTQEKLHALCLDDDYLMVARNIDCLLAH